MPAYLFDTDVLSARLRPRPSLNLAQRMADLAAEHQFTSAITLGELLFGAYRRGLADLLWRIRQLVEALPVLPFDEQAAETYGRLKAELERQGTPLAEPDLRIAATALAYGLTLVTGNERHFARVPGLRVENWLG